MAADSPGAEQDPGATDGRSGALEPNKPKRPARPNRSSPTQSAAAKPAATRQWYQQKRYAFPLIAAVLFVGLVNANADPNEQSGGTGNGTDVSKNDSSGSSTRDGAGSDSSGSSEGGSESGATPAPSSTRLLPAPRATGGNLAAGLPAISITETVGQTGAREKGRELFETLWLSRQGLIEELMFEGFSLEDSTYGADSLGLIWSEEALLFAKNTLSGNWYSRQGLIDRMVYRGFLVSEATVAVDATSTNWKNEAAGMAMDFLEMDFYTYDELVDELIYEGFSLEEAEFGASEAEA